MSWIATPKRLKGFLAVSYGRKMELIHNENALAARV